MDTQTKLTLTDNYGQIYNVTSPSTQIGSAPQCNIILDEPGVMNVHAEIRFEGNIWLIQDVSGENSINVNGQNIQTTYMLKDGDVISIGNSLLRVSMQEAQQAQNPDPQVYTFPQDITADLSGFRGRGESTTANQTVAKKACRACHQLIHPEAEICPHCGVRQIEQPPPTPKVGKKSRVTAAVLAIIFGGVGAHKFYLGKAGQGLLYLVFFWTYIPAILGLIEGIYYLTMNDEQFAKNFG